MAASIQFFRPDLLRDQRFKSMPITLNPPLGYFASMVFLHTFCRSNQKFNINPLSFLPSFFVVGVPDVGEMMAASFPADSKFSEDLSLDNAWYSFIIIISSSVFVFTL